MATRGFEGFNDGDMIASKVRMIQNTSKKIDGMDPNPGEFVDPVAKINLGKRVKVVVLKATKSRHLNYPKGHPQENKTWCHSADFLTPNPSVSNPPATQCSKCEYKMRDRVYLATMLDVKRSEEEGYPVIFTIQLKNTSVTPFLEFTSSVINKKRAPMEFAVDMVGLKSEGTSGSYFVTRFENISEVKAGSELQSLVESAWEAYGESEASQDEDEETTESTTPF